MKELWVSTENKELEKEARFMKATLVKDNRVKVGREELVITNDEGKVDEKAVFEIEVKDKEDEVRATKIGGKVPYLIVKCTDWKIIPLENLIADLRGKTKILAKVNDAREGKVALETLELGVDGVFLETDRIKELREVQKVLRQLETEKISLEEATITKIKELGLGARACLDTSELMKRGEGALVGSSSQGMFLIQAEVEKSPFVSPRPFRVNAGALSLYTLTLGGKTKYLEEIKAGDEILIIDRKGNSRKTFVCRSKIEARPLILVEANHEGKIAKSILQNAETIRLVTKNGSKAVNELKKGDKVLVKFEEGGRHFGRLVKEEQVIEK